MAIVTGSVLVDVLLALIPTLYFIYWFFTNNDDYWDKRGVPNVKRGLLLGTVLGKQSQAEAITEIYNQFPDNKFVGLFQFKRPTLMVQDPTLVNKILVKDFVHFQDRGQPRIKKDIFAQNLFGLRGRIWRTLRYKLTPTFTTGKLRGMFEQVSNSADNMIEKMEELKSTKDSVNDVDPKNFLFEFTLDVITSCAFGVQFPPNSPDFITFKAFTEKMFSVSPFRILKFAFMFLAPKVAEFLNITSASSDVAEYFMNLTRNTIKYRKENNIRRNDYFQLLLSLKEQEESGKDMFQTGSSVAEKDALIDQLQYTEEDDESQDITQKLFTEEAIASNTVIFLIGGSETVSRTIGFTLFELSRHSDIQQKLQQEVDSVLSRHGGWSYEALKDMPYLDQVVQESQRMHPLLPLLQRECVRPYKMPDSDVIIEKGVLIVIPVVSLHKDPKYYPNPGQFDPERFKDNNFKPNATFLPFGDGPRICIAMRFALMEVKACVAKIVSQYNMKLSEKTKLPLQFDPRGFIPIVKDGLFMSFEKRST